MKAISLPATIALSFFMLQACQNANKNTREIQSEVIDSTMEAHTITDTTALNRGAGIADFLNEAALGGMEEIELGKIAIEKSANPGIKDFARQMVKDHTKIAERLKVLADGKKMTLPAALPKADLDHIAEMKNMQANEFDKHYMGMMVKDHVKTLDLFKSATTSGDTPLQNFAISTLRTLESHYKMATSLNDKLK